MVCLGNICRSPTAQGVLDKMIMDIRLDGRLEVD
ncbi:MAG: low molecular weight phosphotyrosine protein phosphatase, partial [Pseudomonadota bacterium]|nr:low molecular weight phosphotyrosine protein phosphatase [Pseudomonadota bacterium]